ncbi:hypothetical protein DR864_28545 (plasmid) [Runella rosea]|uniref:Uncharacterized protein n=1 Tax=Runella rosea TaxID=2259595 RepID=A0A344TT51_9BACT|nr:hypothetical protein [Runella rosea]AXE21822.1 hypothetical protein DR864_28545 [Runella rosea]
MSKEKEGYAENRSKLAEMIKKTPPKTNIQEVRPVATIAPKKEEESHVNIWIPKTLFMKLKMESARTAKPSNSLRLRLMKSILGVIK